MDADSPVFAIAVAAELAGMHPQTLRQYDRIGLVVPGRTRGGSRRYSMRNVEQLREVAQLSSEGVSLPAIARLLDLEDEVRMLRGQDITCLVDVRSYPSSRAHPQWNQQAVVDALPRDIAYRWIRRLGGRRHTPASVPSPNGAWRVKAFRDYADYLATSEFAEGLRELLEIAEHERQAVMCSEAVPWRCHRRLITDALAGKLLAK